MVLTKFDAIDNKVGAAVSMAYSTGKPIIFVGTGQAYHNLRRLNIDTVLEALFAAD
jgi:signal recognition particle receptor subunit alpha